MASEEPGGGPRDKSAVVVPLRWDATGVMEVLVGQIEVPAAGGRGELAGKRPVR